MGVLKIVVIQAGSTKHILLIRCDLLNELESGIHSHHFLKLNINCFLHRIFHLPQNNLEIEELHHLFTVEDFHDLIYEYVRIMTCTLEGGVAVHDEQTL